MKRFLPVLVCLVVFIFFAFNIKSSGKSCEFQKQIGKCVYLLQADTDELRIQGLSGRESLPSDSAMLFTFPEEGYHGIWMKDMKFPIDIYWLDVDKNVVTIQRIVTPETYPKVFYPEKPARYVIETTAN